MTTPIRQLSFEMAHRTTFSLADAANVEIVCERGTLWITLDGDPKDVVIEAGERHAVPQHRRAVLYALDASQVTLRARSTHGFGIGPARRDAWRALSERLAGAWRGFARPALPVALHGVRSR